jgi:hypothetical protein
MSTPWNAVEYLKKRHTKELLNIRDMIYRVSGYNYYDVTDGEVGCDPLSDCSGGRCWVTLEQVKAELATRPHVPNKAEAKVIRQQRAKEQRSR